jgi:primosomal protein N' (replication factor Y)
VEVLAPAVVEVAIDAAGAGARSYSYIVPDHLAPLEPGEAVLVEFGRRQAVGIVLGAATDGLERATKAVAGRVRADGPLLPPLAMRFAAWIADHYLAPPSVTLRAMLPPGLLERLELIAERRPEGSGAAAGSDGGRLGGGPEGLDGLDAEDQRVLGTLDSGPRAVRSIATEEGRPAVLRRLRRLASIGLVDLEWTLLQASIGPKYERRASLAAEDRAADAGSGPARSSIGLGPRQRALLDELAEAEQGVIPTAVLAARHGSATVASLARRGLVTIASVEVPRRPLDGRVRPPRGSRPTDAVLSAPQAEALARIDAGLAEVVGRGALSVPLPAAPKPRPILLDGVTGGGKTAIYSEAIRLVLGRGRPALVLVPEIALALPLIDRLRADLEVRVAVLHSGLSDGERADEWRRIRAGDVDVVVGTRVAVLAPLSDVGLVIVDEEHDPAYKSDRTPRIQARDSAIELAALARAVVVLGSATPSVESEGRARDGAYERVRLPVRMGGARPEVQVVDLRAELAAGNAAMLSRDLAGALAALQPPDQAILVINRRGTASVVLCRDCGHVQACPDCARPLVFHQAGVTLRCHHCGRATPLATRCPNCGSARIRYLGGGTERLEREVRDRLPNLRIGRLDRDVAERRGAAARVIDAFSDGAIDVLVGTSLVTKGLDIPAVTLVGVVSADVALNLPDERAAERTFQLLEQAVGRAGRGEAPGLAIIQTYQPDHPAIQAVRLGDAGAFYDAELDLRRRFGSPPFGRLVKLTVALADREAAEAAGRQMSEAVWARAEASTTAIDVAGPAPAFIARRAERWRYNLVLRAADPSSIFRGPARLAEALAPPWSIDVDPDTLL